jgi:simple sugar transport system ATP-binding protein
MDSQSPLLKGENIKKSYGHVEALKGVDFILNKGEILGLVGDNAAGKSTLVQILSGAVSLDTGKIFLDGQEARIGNPASSRALGIETVYQQFALVDNLPVYTNVFLGRLIKRKVLGSIPILDKRKMQDEVFKVINLMGIQFDSVKRKVSDLSGGQRQAVAIARALLFNPRILILDEPTSGLAVKEVKKVQDIILNFKEKEISVIFISHRLESIFETADRIMVLRSGVKAMDEKKENITSQDVVEKMFGLDQM